MLYLSIVYYSIFSNLWVLVAIESMTYRVHLSFKNVSLCYKSILKQLKSKKEHPILNISLSNVLVKI